MNKHKRCAGTSVSIVAMMLASAFVRLSRPVVIKRETMRAEGALQGDPSGDRSTGHPSPISPQAADEPTGTKSPPKFASAAAATCS